MNIMMAGNEKVYFGIELAMYSTMFYNKNVHWYIVSMNYDQIQENGSEIVQFFGLSDWQREKLEKIVEYFEIIEKNFINRVQRLANNMLSLLSQQPESRSKNLDLTCFDFLWIL